MSEVPWRAEIDLSPARVREIVRAQFPEVAAERVRLLGEGWESRAFEVDGVWVFRFPKRAGFERAIATEVAIVPRIAPRLPLAVPDYRFVGRPGPLFPWPFSGYRKLEGALAPDLEIPADAIAPVGAALGRFLAALHAVPLEEAERAGVPHDFWIAEAGESSRRDAIAALRTRPIAGAVGDDLAARAIAWLEVAPPLEPPPESALRLVHNDFLAEHVVLDPERRAPVGVIDWGDVAIGDPASEFAGLLRWHGEPLARAALHAYAAAGGAGDARVLERVRPIAIFVAVEDLEYGVATGHEEYVRAGVRALRLNVPA